MNTLYVTYLQNGRKRRGAITSAQYAKLEKDTTVSNLQIHPNQIQMEQAYGNSTDNRSLLFG